MLGLSQWTRETKDTVCASEMMKHIFAENSRFRMCLDFRKHLFRSGLLDGLSVHLNQLGAKLRRGTSRRRGRGTGSLRRRARAARGLRRLKVLQNVRRAITRGLLHVATIKGWRAMEARRKREREGEVRRQKLRQANIQVYTLSD